MAVVFVFYKELLVTSFDAGFARSIALPSEWIHHGLMLLVAFAVVIALQAVGVVLVSAMLITPAAAAYLLTDRMHRMLLLAVGFGVGSGVLGAFISFLKPNIPTGPCMVLGASALFAVAFFGGPRHGVLTRWWRHVSRSKRVQRENTLKALFQVLERRDAEPEDSISLKELAERRRETLDEVSSQASALKQHGFVTLHEEGNKILFTPSGWQLACTIVRNHRLWELYLTNEANIAPTTCTTMLSKSSTCSGMMSCASLSGCSMTRPATRTAGPSPALQTFISRSRPLPRGQAGTGGARERFHSSLRVAEGHG